MIKSYTWKKRRSPSFDKGASVSISKDEEVLYGQVDGMKASAPEERLAKASEKYAKRAFRVAVNAPRGDPGWKELDFLFESQGIISAVEVDQKSFIHRGENEKQDFDDLIRLEGLKKMGIYLSEIIHIDADKKLADETMAAKTARELFT